MIQLHIKRLIDSALITTYFVTLVVCFYDTSL